MRASVKAAFEHRILHLEVDEILPLRQVSENQRKSVKYQRIRRSIQEIGIIEPPVVARPAGGRGPYLLVDGHLRLAALVELGRRHVQCLISTDDESFTYNKRVSRLATIQEHYMIVRAIQRGVPEEKIAKALDVDVSRIWKQTGLLDGICRPVIDLLRDKRINHGTFDVLRKMKPERQFEVAELMTTVGNYSSSYAKALLAATRAVDLLNPHRPKKVAGITPEQMVKMEREMETLLRDVKTVETTYGDDMLNLMVATGYLAKLLSNTEVEGYLGEKYPELLEGFRNIIASASLE